MSMISDDDLVLYHYRDGLDGARIAEIEDALFADPSVRARYAALRGMLEQVDALPAPEPDAGFEQRLWSGLAPRLQAPPERQPGAWQVLRALFVLPPAPRLAFVPALALALVLGVAFYAGRYSAPEPVPAPVLVDAGHAGDSQAVAARVMQGYVAGHLRATEGLLMTASNSDDPALREANREVANSLLDSNRLYALAAARAGNLRLADFLRQLEPVLLDLANPAGDGTVQDMTGLREYLKKTDLLFQVRATEARMKREGVRSTTST